MKITLASICKQGGREYNQDFLASKTNGKEACLVVCDGLGSYVGSEVASRLCATKIVELFEKVYNADREKAFLPETVQAYVQNSHNFVSAYKEQNPVLHSSCTTVACFVTDGNASVMSHIGDTRIYLFKQGKLAYQSKDHSLSQLAVERGEIALRDIRTHKDQNKLTRVLGNDYYIPPDCEITRTPLVPGDYVILCTDGFWEYVYEEEMEHDLVTSPTPQDALAKMEQRLLMRVNKFNDNYSDIVAFATEDGEAI